MRYGYARVSTVGQEKNGNSLEAQEKALKDNGAEVIIPEAYTGTKKDRPKFQELLSKLEDGDTLIVTKLDRFSRSAVQGMTIVEELLNRGVKVHVLNMGLMDNTPTGKLIRQIMFAFAEFERDCIVERTQEGKSYARMRDDYKEGRKVVEVTLLNKVSFLIDQGVSVSSACKQVGIARSTYYKYSN